MSYHEFIKSKQRRLKPMGFDPRDMNGSMFPFQKHITELACVKGRSAIFAECGLGKTLMQLAWAEQVCNHTAGNVVIHCPVGVRHQTRREAEKFGIETPVHVVNTPGEIVAGISLVNYEKLHLFDGIEWAGVVLDESSILKGFTGKTKRLLCDAYAQTHYRLACTATPAPNDHSEIGNHAEFLGVCTRLEMLSEFFVHDSGDTAKWRLKGHAVESFWNWVASWAISCEKPSDIGFSDDGYELPELVETEHMVDVFSNPSDGELFASGGVSATTMHSVKRETAESRSRVMAELVNASSDAWCVWCDTNYEADHLRRMIADAIEVRGSDSEEAKERKLNQFSNGESRVIITKPTVAGFGMNWQHCFNVGFVGVSYSYEQYYQALRRTWRFGQTRPVNAHIITTPDEKRIADAVKRKAASHREMKKQISASIVNAHRECNSVAHHTSTQKVRIPEWIV